MAEQGIALETTNVGTFLAETSQEAPDGIQSLTRAQCRQLMTHVTVEAWRQHPDELAAFTRLLINRGFAHEAFDVLRHADDGADSQVQQLRAYAMAKTGALASSSELLHELLDAGFGDIETLGLLGSNEKALARRSAQADDAEAHWRQARGYYGHAFEVFNDPYPGINAAAVTLRLGDVFAARQIAHDVGRVCQAQLDRGDRGDYWLLATLAESYLIRGQLDFARQAFASAISSHRADISSIGTTYQQARQILGDLGLPPDLFDHIFRMPTVVVFSGHRIDAKKRESPRLPRQNLKRVAAGIRRFLEASEDVVGYSAAADGADILFLEALLEIGAEVHVVLPMEVAEFRRQSVKNRQDQWRLRFDHVIEQADSVTITGEGIDPNDDAHFQYCNQVTLGLARLKASELVTRVRGLTVWDGRPGLPGGTGDCLALWHEHQIDVTVLDPKTGAEVSEGGEPHEGKLESQVKSMVFADIVGYSTLDERGIAAYYKDVLPRIANLTCEIGVAEVMRDSWGDAFYYVFDATSAAARFALALQKLFKDVDLHAAGETPLRIRIGVHAGPLTSYYDPIRDRMNYTGRHTSKAARTEPIADENQIIATQQFAALLTNETADAFELAYAGELSLAKSYGTERMFVLSERAA